MAALSGLKLQDYRLHEHRAAPAHDHVTIHTLAEADLVAPLLRDGLLCGAGILGNFPA